MHVLHGNISVVPQNISVVFENKKDIQRKENRIFDEYKYMRECKYMRDSKSVIKIGF